jgi:NAD-dependent SIR2 family protein deacetylase
MPEPRPLRSLRHLRCPSCGAVQPANHFRREPRSLLGQARICPVCEHIAPLQDFAIVERAANQGEVS